MQSIIFHVGQAKTGTTSIQRFFARNRQGLLAQGMLYPKLSVGSINHGALSVPTLGKVQRSLVPVLGSNFNSALDTSLNLWKELGQKFRKKNPEKLIVSSEFLFPTENIQTIVDLTREFISPNADIKFILYLRLQSDFYASALQQKLRAASFMPPLNFNNGRRQALRFADHGTTVGRFFSRDSLKSQDILSDICSVLGVVADGFVSIRQQANRSISSEGSILLQEYRRLHHADNENVFTEDTSKFISRIEKEEARNQGKYTKIRVRPEIAQYLDRRTPETTEVKERFGIELWRDHGVSAPSETDVLQLKNVEDVVEFDRALVEEMRRNLRE